MPISLENQFIADTFKALLHTGSIGLSSGSPKAKVYSGAGSESSLTIGPAFSGIEVSGDIISSGNIISNGSSTMIGPLSSGSQTINGNCYVSNNATIIGSLNSGSHTVDGNSIINGNSTLNGSSTINGSLSCDSQIVGGDCYINGNSRIKGNSTIIGALNSGQHTVTGTSNISGNTIISGSLNSGSHTVNGDSNVTNKITTNEIFATTYLNLPKGDSREDLINHIYPVGSVFLSFNNINPGTRFSGTIWSQIASGRFIVGVGSGNDGLQNKNFNAGNNPGTYTHKLEVPELPGHTHSVSNIGGAESDSGTGDSASPIVGQAGLTGSTGGGQAHENTPPGFGLYVWQRTQ